jgi:DNA polymerase III sliding clamp (beta) subunit (PCNA family)
MQTIKCLRENVIKTLTSIKDDNVSIFDVQIERRRLLEALKLLTSDTLTLNYGRVSWIDKHSNGADDYEGFIASQINDEPCLQIQADKMTMRFLNRAVIKRNPRIVPINFIESYVKPESSGTLIDVKELIEAINYVAISRATEQARPNLTCIYFECENDKIKLTTADGFRLGMTSIQAKGIPAGNFLIDFTEIIRLLPFLKSLIVKGKNKSNPDLYISVDKTAVKFLSGNNSIELYTFDGIFPKYQQLIPTTGTTNEFIASELLEVVKALHSIAKDSNGIIRLQFTKELYEDKPIGKIALSSKSEELGDLKTECNAIVETDCKIAFNSKYLIDLLKLAKDSKVTMLMSTESSSALFTMGNKTQVLMPMFVKWDDDKPAEPIKQEPQDEVEEYIEAYPIEDTELVNA